MKILLLENYCSYVRTLSIIPLVSIPCMFLVCLCRSHLRTEVEVLTGKLERANLAKSMADSKLSELDRYKAMIELEMNEILARHKTAMTEKMARAVQVRREGKK